MEEKTAGPNDSSPSRYDAFAERCATGGAYLAGAALVAICVLVMSEIIARNVLGTSTMIADEMCGYLNVAVVFLGLAYTMQQGGFIRVELLYHKFATRTKRIADALSVLLSFAYICIVLYYMAKYALFSYQNDIRSAELTQTPLFIPQAVLVLGACLLVIYLLKFILNRFRDVP
jgi:TRAP-type C4-dicarboxylate transport system permease small subunit